MVNSPMSSAGRTIRETIGLRDSILTRIVVYAVIPVLLIQGLSTLYSLWMIRSQALHDLGAIQSQIVEELTRSLPDPLWNYQMDRVHELIEIKMKQDAFVGVAIEELKSGNILMSLEKKEGKLLERNAFLTGNLIRQASVMNYADAPVWKITYYFSADSIRHTVNDSLVRSLVAALLTPVSYTHLTLPTIYSV